VQVEGSGPPKWTPERDGQATVEPREGRATERKAARLTVYPHRRCTAEVGVTPDAAGDASGTIVREDGRGCGSSDVATFGW
jgi:hypothetical protein